MITRYTRPEMGAIWSDETKFQTWLEIELYACEAQYKLGLLSRKDLNTIKRKARFRIRRIEKLESRLHHDVIAFLTNVSEQVGPSGRFIHFGLTSSDILDTALSVQMVQAADLLLKDLNVLRKALSVQAKRYQNTFMVGRTHGVHAEPITFGLKFLIYLDEISRGIDRLKAARERIRVAKISGAVGTYAQVDPSVEKHVCKQLGLIPARAATQVVQRDRHAEFLTVIALIGATFEKIATEIRHLQRTEVLEAEEPFGKGQKGSSAMPHKKNPILCERITGLARVLRGNAMVGMENVALWHERDISHSSAERVVLPDSTILLDYMAHKLTYVVKGLRVYPKQMQKNLDRTHGLIHSQSILLELIRAGMAREEAYALVQRQAMKTWEGGGDFKEAILSESKVQRLLGAKRVNQICNLATHGKRINQIFKRFGV
jgi:adenylosuccinate lyase